MLWHPGVSSSLYSAQPVESIPQPSGTNAYLNQGVAAALRLPDRGMRAGEEEKKDQKQTGKEDCNEEQDGPLNNPLSLYTLNGYKDLSEMIRLLWRPEQRKILLIKNTLYLKRPLIKEWGPILSPGELHLDRIRHKTYHLAIQIHLEPMGMTIHVSI